MVLIVHIGEQVSRQSPERWRQGLGSGAVAANVTNGNSEPLVPSGWLIGSTEKHVNMKMELSFNASKRKHMKGMTMKHEAGKGSSKAPDAYSNKMHVVTQTFTQCNRCSFQRRAALEQLQIPVRCGKASRSSSCKKSRSKKTRREGVCVRGATK